MNVRSMRKISKPVRFESNVTQMRLERVPGELQLGLSTLSGTNLVGPLVIKATKPKDVRLSEVTDSVSIDLEEGDVEVTQTKLPMPRVDVRVRSGSVDLALPTAAKCSVNASTSHGEISNDFDDRLKQSANGKGAKLIGSLGGTTEVKLSTDRVTVRKSGPGMIEPATPPTAPSQRSLRAPAAPKAPLAPPEKVTN